jgi:O-antigen ligase
MTRRPRGWRSARAWDTKRTDVGGGPTAASVPSAAPVTGPTPYLPGGRAQLLTRLAAAPRAKISFSLAAIILYLWVIHSYKLAIGDVAIGAALVAVLLKPGTIRVPPPLMFFAGFVAWSAIGLVVSLNQQATYDELVVLVKVWLVVFVIFNGIQSAAQLRVLVIAWLGIFALYPLRGAFYNQFVCHCTPAGRVAWNFVFENPNDLAALSFLPLGLAALVALIEPAKLWRNLAVGGIVFLGLLIFLTQSRGAMIALIITALWTILSRRRARDFLFIAAAAVVVWLAAPDSVWQRLGGLMNVSVDKGMRGVDDERSAESRWLIWKVAAKVIRSQPATGVGLAMYPYHHGATVRSVSNLPTVQGQRDAHSTYLRVAAETGLIGLGLYLALCFSTFGYVRRVRKEIGNTRPREQQALLMLQLSLVALLIAAFFGSFGVFVYAYLHFGAVLLVADVLKREPWPTPANALSATQPVDKSFVGATRLSARRGY